MAVTGIQGWFTNDPPNDQNDIELELFARKRSRTWDGSMVRVSSIGSTAYESNEDETDSTCEEEQEQVEIIAPPLVGMQTGGDIDSFFPSLASMWPPGCMLVGQWVHREHDMLIPYCMVDVHVPASEDSFTMWQTSVASPMQTATTLDDDAEAKIRMATQLKQRAQHLRAAAGIDQNKTEVTQHSKAAEVALVVAETTVGAADAANTGSSDESMRRDYRTTIMLKNLPNDYTRDMVLALLDSEGFAGTYDFIYLPSDFQRWVGFGYGFVNCVSHADARRMSEHFHGFRNWTVRSSKVCEVCWSEPMQGLAANIDRYRNSPVMHDSVPDVFKPAVFHQGQRVEFPAPSKRIRLPRPGHRMH